MSCKWRLCTVLTLLAGVRLLPSEAAPRFEPNLGQAAPEARFVVRGAAYTLLVRRDAGMTYLLAPRDQTGEIEQVAVKLAGANPAPAIAGEQRLPGVTRYYLGPDPRRWIPEVPSYARVRCRNVYPGIDLVYRGGEGSIEFDFLVAAGAEPGHIRLALRGVAGLRVDSLGDLVMETNGSKLRWRHPKAWQEIGGKRREVAVRFRILEDDEVGFTLGPYSRRHGLVIDPVVRYSTYLGGGQLDQAWAVAADSSGAACVAGDTWSVQFPASGTNVTARASRDAFVAKFDPSGTSLQYLVFLGGGSGDSARAIAVDGAGNAYVAGVTSSMDFPATAGAWRRTHGGLEDGFIVKLNPGGTVAYATYVGAGGSDFAVAIAVDGNGAVYVAGYTSSVAFPVTAGAYQTTFRGGPYDAFLVKLNAAGSAPVYATLLGGSRNDVAYAVGVDSAGNAWVGGQTESNDFPLVSAAQGQFGGQSDGFIAKFSSTGALLLYSSFLGGFASDAVDALAVDSAGACYIAGHTYSSNFPVSASAPQHSIAGGYDAFVAKIGPAGGAPVFATLLGGRDTDQATGIRVDGAGNVWVAGFTRSPDFPRVNATGSYRGEEDGFLAVLNPAGTAFTSSDLIGGSAQDRISGLALDASGNAYVAGTTSSSDFPVTQGVFRSSPAGGGDAFLAKVSVNFPPQALSVTPSSGSGWSQVFQFSVTDPNGWQDISWGLILINGIFSGANACYLYFNPSQRALWLSNDAGTAWIQGTLGSGTIENSQCVVSLSQSGVSGSGTTLTVTAALTFKSSFGGLRKLYLMGEDSAGAQAGWRQVGLWSISSAWLFDLIWQQDVTRQVTAHRFEGLTMTGWHWLNQTGNQGWTVTGAADFDGNGYPDLVWQDDASRQVVVQFFVGTEPSGMSWLNSASNPGWRVVAVGDMNADGKPDLVWQNETTRQVTAHYYSGPTGTEFRGWAWLSSTGFAGWRIVGVADFDGNGTPDLVWQNDSTRQVTVHYYSHTQWIGWNWLNQATQSTWTVAGVGDLNGDGKPDLVWQNDGTRQVTVHFYGGEYGSQFLAWAWLYQTGYSTWRLLLPA